MSKKRTYKGYGKALDGAHKILDPEEKVAIRHTYFVFLMIGIATTTIHKLLGLTTGILGMCYHIWKLRNESKRGEI